MRQPTFEAEPGTLASYWEEGDEETDKAWQFCFADTDVSRIYLRAIAHAADPLWESKVGVAFGMVNLDTHGPTKNQNDRFNFL